MKKKIIIGASSGIGKGLAKLLSENDYKVGITGRRTELLEELKKKKSCLCDETVGFIARILKILPGFIYDRM